MSEAGTASYEFDEAFQERIAGMFLSETSFASRVHDLVKPEYFTNNATKTVMRVAQDHFSVYKTAPEMTLMGTLIKDAFLAKRIRKDEIPEIRDLLRRVKNLPATNLDYIVDKVSKFARHQAIEQAIMESVGLLEKGDFDKISDRIKQAVSVGESQVFERYDYFKEIESRTKKREDILAGKIVRNGITTGYSGMDAYLYHAGWGRKELSCIMGPAKSGKSLSLGDFCKNASLAGYNVLYVSCEVAKEIIAERIDAALSSTIMNELHKKPADVRAEIIKAEKGAGHFEFQDRPSGTMKPSHLRTMLEKFAKEGIIFDLVAVDYADIMAPEFRTDDLREALRTIYIDLRAIASEFNIALLTATQTNRDGAKSITSKATDVGDDWNKARTVDILIGINVTDEEKRAGEARLYWALSRNTQDGFTLRIKQDRQRMQFLTKIIGKE